jgi:predicted GIY-YIG superfamily endonuclease
MGRSHSLCANEADARCLASFARELQIKKWSRAKKEALIAGNKHRLKELSRCRKK